jgi:hypothetical protein
MNGLRRTIQIYFERTNPNPLRTANAVLAMGGGVMSFSITAMFRR